MLGCMLPLSEYSIVLRIARCKVRKARVARDRYVATTASNMLLGVSVVSYDYRYAILTLRFPCSMADRQEHLAA